MKYIKYTDSEGNIQLGTFIEVDNDTLIYKDKDGKECATLNWTKY